jgi:hypothetical protein
MTVAEHIALLLGRRRGRPPRPRDPLLAELDDAVKEATPKMSTQELREARRQVREMIEGGARMDEVFK